jgi:hypothetical protein
MTGRTDVLLVVLLVLFSLGAGMAQTPVPVKFVSTQPAFAKLALTADGQKVLLLAADESGGTGTGYDTIYADANLNSVIETAEQVKRAGTSEYDPYTPIVFPFGYNDSAAGLKEPLKLTVTRSAMGSGFAVSLRVLLRHKGQDWEYYFRQPLTLVTDLAKAPVLAARPLTVNLQTRMGNGLGMAATLAAGTFSISCYAPQGSPQVRLRVLGADGQTVSDTTAPLDRLGYG